MFDKRIDLEKIIEYSIKMQMREKVDLEIVIEKTCFRLYDGEIFRYLVIAKELYTSQKIYLTVDIFNTGAILIPNYIYHNKKYYVTGKYSIGYDIDEETKELIKELEEQENDY